MRSKGLLVLLALNVFVGYCLYRSTAGPQCIAVLDGDTLVVLDGFKERRIRLWGIDAPERKQPAGEEAKELLKSLVLKEPVKIEGAGYKSRDREVARVMVDNKDVAAELLAAGLAWIEPRYIDQLTPDTRAEYKRAQKTAMESHIGIWAGSPVPPWEWRKR